MPPHQIKAQRQTHESDASRFVVANPDLIAEALEFFSKNKERMKKEDEGHQQRISIKVDAFFDQLDRKGWSDEEDVESSIDNDHEAGPSRRDQDSVER